MVYVPALDKFTVTVSTLVPMLTFCPAMLILPPLDLALQYTVTLQALVVVNVIEPLESSFRQLPIVEPLTVALPLSV